MKAPRVITPYNLALIPARKTQDQNKLNNKGNTEKRKRTGNIGSRGTLVLKVETINFELS